MSSIPAPVAAATPSPPAAVLVMKVLRLAAEILYCVKSCIENCKLQVIIMILARATPLITSVYINFTVVDGSSSKKSSHDCNSF